MARIGIRREDKSRWEARVPLVPADVARYVKENGLEIVVQTSPHRAFKEAEYQAAGATVAEDLTGCPLIMGIKEIPVEKLEPGKTYVYFSHTIKGQSGNMPALRRLMELKCQLIDYEKIIDERGRRLVFFGTFAGMAGMIDSLWALGQRLQHEGIANPFSRMQQAYHYRDVAHAKEEVAKVGEDIKRHGLPETLRPFVCGFAGYGQVSTGAQDVFDKLPIETITPQQLASLPPSPHACYKVVFREEDMVERIEPAPRFDLQEYYKQPERYRGRFAQYVPHLTMLMNCIYWESKYPRLVTLDQLRDLYARGATPRLRVLGDISCDLNGSIECTVKCTKPDHPVFVYEPDTGTVHDGVEGRGPVVLAVDFLPCELPVDSSRFFSRSLQPFVVPLAGADFSRPFAECGLPAELERATIVYHGDLTPSYRYLERFLK